jgi:hypothetical protein
MLSEAKHLAYRLTKVEIHRHAASMTKTQPNALAPINAPWEVCPSAPLGHGRPGDEIMRHLGVFWKMLVVKMVAETSWPSTCCLSSRTRLPTQRATN